MPVTSEALEPVEPEPPRLLILPQGFIVCDTIEAAELLADDLEDPNIPIPGNCGHITRPVPHVVNLVGTYDAGRFRYWVIEAVGPDGVRRFSLGQRQLLTEVLGTAI